MAEYIFTNLPQYVRITPRSDFSSSVVSSGAVLLFSEDGLTLTGKLPDGTFITIGGSSGPAPVGNATSGDILTGKSATVSGGSVISGVIPTVSGGTMTPTTSDQIISSGVYLGGSQVILGDSNLVAANIASGVSIFGVSGTYQGGGGSSSYDFGNTEAGDVLSGKKFLDSAGRTTTGTIPTVSATLAANVTTVPSGYIASAQELTVPLASSATVAGGIVTIPAGYVPAEYTVSAGGSSAAENVSSGAYIAEGEPVAVSSGWEYLDADLRDNGGLIVLNGGSIVNALAGNYSWAPGGITISSGGIAMQTIVSGGNLRVSSGGSADGTIITGGSMAIYNGGAAENNFLLGGKIEVSSGAVISQTNILGGSAVISSGGTADITYVRQGGRLDVDVYGQAVSITVRGTLDVFGSADHVHVCSGGIMYQREGSTITNLVVDEGGEVQ